MYKLICIVLTEVFFIFKLSDKFVKQVLKFKGMVLLTVVVNRCNSQGVYSFSATNPIKQTLTFSAHEE